MYLHQYQYKQKALHFKLQTLARIMRKNPTAAELCLWKYLRNRKIASAKFRRQHPFFIYILDFYCLEYKLIIEVDGSSHLHRFIRDQNRDTIFENEGYTILRFSNDEVLEDTEYVVNKIKSVIEQKTPLS